MGRNDLSKYSNINGNSGEVKNSSWKATSDNTKLIGRNVIKDDVTWLVQSGSAVEFNVTGESAEIVLAGDSGTDSDEDHRPRYAVYVDDELILDEILSVKKKKIEIFSGKSSITKKVKVIMLSEAIYGAIGVDSINVSSGAAKPVKPVAKNNICIEFIGDSITCAYGVESKNSEEPFKTSTENFTKSYAYLTAQKLGADYSTVCYSGHGIISGYTGNDQKDPKAIIPDCYEYASKRNGYTDKWDFESHKSDIIVINLGTNDSLYITGNSRTDLKKRSQEFIDEYIKFLKTVRKNNNQSYIICTLGTMDYYNISKFANKAVEKYRSETDDNKITFYRSVMQNAADGYGSDSHPSEVTQQKISCELSDKIRQILEN